MQWIELPGFKAEISAAPVDCQTYCTYLSSSGQPLPRCPSSRQKPLVGVSASAARAFAAWLTRHENQAYRLPALHELLGLAQQAREASHHWPCTRDHRSVETMMDCAYEWLNCAPEPTRQRTQLHCATHPLWLRQPRPIHAALADTALAYVTFRLVRTLLEIASDTNSRQGAYR